MNKCKKNCCSKKEPCENKKTDDEFKDALYTHTIFITGMLLLILIGMIYG
jgi:hypothetical protein